MTFAQKLNSIIEKNNSLLCVGLDSDIHKIPPNFQSEKNPQFSFNQTIIEATHDMVCAYKPNSAFYEARGADGIRDLKLTCDYLRKTYPEIVIILDAKRGDIGNTNEGYVTYAFDWLGVDAITLHPYLGREAIQPFLDRKDKGCIILCRTSNPGAGEFQDLNVDPGNQAIKLYQYIAKKVSKEWNENGNCGLVMGATYPAELAIVRRIVGEAMPFLVPGIGTQGGNMEKAIKAGINSKGTGLIVNVSRTILFSPTDKDVVGYVRKEVLTIINQINTFRI